MPTAMGNNGQHLFLYITQTVKITPFTFYLRQRDYVFGSTCSFACSVSLSVSSITHKVTNGLQ